MCNLKRKMLAKKAKSNNKKEPKGRYSIEYN